MSVQSKTALNTTIDTDITTNGSNDITGAQVNAILGNMVDSYEDFIGSYTTAQIAALVGMTLRQRVFNTTDNDYEYYDGTRWVKEAHPKYKVYTALLTQAGVAAPVAVEKENTLGVTITFAYLGVGVYEVNASGNIFDSGTVFLTQLNDAGQMVVVGSSATQVLLGTYDTTGASTDAVMVNPATFEIRAYY